MVNVSTAWLRALTNDQRDYQITISMTLANGVSLTIRNQHIWQNSFGIDDAVSSDNDFQIGAAIINKCNFSLNNMYGDFDTFDFLNARLSVSVGLMVEGSLETIRKGSFVIVNNPTYNGALINIEAYDYMYFFDVPYSQNNTVYPTTADVIVRDMCTDLGVPLNTYDFPNKNTTISERPTEEATTYREVLSYIGQICGCYARCNVYGQLELKWYDQDALDSPTYAYDGGSFDADTPYATGDAVNGGVFNPWETGDVAEGGAFSWNSSVHFISSVYSRDISTEDVVITGIRILVKTKENDSSEETIKEFLEGTTGYVIEISENPFINISNADAIATRLANAIVGFRFRKANISHGSDPSIEAGDVAFVFDRKQNVYPIVISHTIFKNGSEQQTYSAAQDVYKNVAARYSAETKNYVDLRRRIKNERTSREEVEAALRRDIANASGLYETEVTETGGAVTRYLHNKPDLAESNIQIMVSDVGITVTADSGEHWYGLRVNGDLIARILTAIGVNADWINAGQLVIRDQQGNVTFYADTETGTVRIVASEFSLTGGSTIQSIANQAKSEAITSSNAYADTKSTQALNSAKAYSDEKLGDYKDEVSAIIDGIQDQLDGAIETWYYDYQPTLNNYPASDWTTETDRKTHEGDLFYWKSTGYSYRFLKNDTTGNWEWQIVQDTGISTAIAKAEAAQDTADHKRRVFITQPTPPYDKGDLWAQGENGDLMRCTTARASGTYVASDWTRASRYTDDSALNSFVNNTYSSAISSIQGQLDRKIDTYYQTEDPSTNWTSAELSEHVGDMWFNSSSLVQKYYRWNGTSWSELTATPPAEVFDQIDGKAQIFVSTPTTPYNVGDLWFDSATSDIMTCVTARATGDYTATDWQKRNKYTDDTAVNNLEIGGRNLLAISKTRTLPYTTYGITLSYEGEGWFRVNGTWNRTGGAYFYVWSYTADDSPWREGTYTLTVENDNLLADNVLHIYYSTGTVNRVPVGSTTFEVTYSLRSIGLYFLSGHSGTVYDGRFRLKLERGNKATADWVAAPEDLESEIENLGETLQSQIDGKIQTYVQATNPATWSVSERNAHDGDLWYYTGESDATYKNNTTYIYRASSDSWAAYAVSPDLFDTVDGKSQVFTEQPSPPYQEGDLWVQGANGDIYRCITSRSSGSYNSSDWDRASKYTDDSALNDWIDGEFASTIRNVRGQIDGKADTYYQARNPALYWNTDALKSEHVSDLWYCSATSGEYAQKYWRYSESYEWQEITADVPDAVFDTINNKAQIFVGSANPVPPYNVGDLWFNSTQDGTGDIYTCVTSRAEDSSYYSSDWAIRNKYTDDSVAKAKYGKCTTNADVEDKKVTIPGFKLFDGAMITVFFSHSNTVENPTLNVNGTGAMPIWVKGAPITSAHYWRYTDVVDFVYSEGSEDHWEAMIESQEEIFNRLTNYGQIRGIYMQDGQLYVNATYILVGTMSADRVRGGTFAAGGSTLTTSQGKNGIIDVFNSDDERIVRIDANGIRVGNIASSLSAPNIYMRHDGYLETDRFRATGYVRIAGRSDTSNKSYLKIPIVNGYEEADDDCYFEVGDNGVTIKTLCYMPLNDEDFFTEAGATLKAGGILQRKLYSGYGENDVVGGYVCVCTNTMTTKYIYDYAHITPFRIFLFNKQRSSTRASIESNKMLIMNSDGTKKVELNLTDGVWTQLGGHFGGSVTMASNLYVSGNKHRLVETEDYGKRVLYCYETASPVFGDIGEGVIGEDGKCYISIDAILAETINSSEYQVFLQKYGDGDCYVSERKSGYFVVSGTPGMSFGWELKAKQYDAMQNRLENIDLVKTPSEISDQIDYANQAEIHINQILNERIPQDEGSNVSDTL